MLIEQTYGGINEIPQDAVDAYLNSAFADKKDVVNKKVLILGNMRHGKDTLAEIWRDQFGLTFKSSSLAAAEIFLFNLMMDKYGYKTSQECYEDRVNHRKEWHDLICEYNKDDKARLAKEILKTSNCYVGMRSSEEIQECKSQNLFDIIVWVDASKRLPAEGKDSFNITVDDADFVIQNNQTLEEFRRKAIRIGNIIFR